MNNNKQLNKGDKMRKIVMTLGILSVLATSSLVFTANAEAASWVCRPNYYGGGQTCTYNPY